MWAVTRRQRAIDAIDWGSHSKREFRMVFKSQYIRTYLDILQLRLIDL